MTPTSALVAFLATLSAVANTSAGVYMTAAPSVAELGNDAPAVVVQLVSAPPVTQAFSDAVPRRYTYDIGVTGYSSQANVTTAIAQAIHDALHNVDWAATGWDITGSMVIDLIEESPRDPESEVTFFNLGLRVWFDAVPE